MKSAVGSKRETKIAVVGAGQIGTAITGMLRGLGYSVHVLEASQEALDRVVDPWAPVTGAVWRANSKSLLTAADVSLLDGCTAVVNAGPHDVTRQVANLATLAKVAYFDLTEDVSDAEYVNHLASQNPDVFYAPQCGLAPGAVSIIAGSLADGLDVRKVELRVGALPQNPTNALKYNLSWSTAGLVNEYLNSGRAIRGGKEVVTLPLEELEELTLDGVVYEAFNTSGGLGTLDFPTAEVVNYKTLRYPGHRDLVKFMVDDLQLSREELASAFETAAPRTYQDVVVISVSVTGLEKDTGVTLERRYVNQIRSDGVYTAIQRTTAGALVGILELYLTGKLVGETVHGLENFLKQEEVPLEEFLRTVHGSIYRLK